MFGFEFSIFLHPCICVFLLQSALTGESLAVTKRTGEKVLSGSICKQGEIEAAVFATGVHTFLGKAAHLVHSTHQVGHFQKVSLESSLYVTIQVVDVGCWHTCIV